MKTRQRKKTLKDKRAALQSLEWEAIEGLKRALQGKNAAATVAAAKVVLADFFKEKSEAPENTGPQVVEFWQEGTPEDASADANGPTKNRLEGYTIPTGDNKQSGQN